MEENGKPLFLMSGKTSAASETRRDDLELELGGETERGEDVVMALHGDEERLLAIEGAGKGFEMEIAGGAFVGGKFCFADVVLRLDEFGAKHGDGFGGGAGALPLSAEAPEPSVAAVMAAGLRRACSRFAGWVLTIMVWPEMSAPGPWPVWMVVTPKPRM